MTRRVLLLSYALDLGGSERQLAEVARHLDPSRFEAHVGCMKPGGLRFDELARLAIPITVFPMRSFFSLEALRRAAQLRDYVTRHDIGLVHAFDVPMDIFGIPAAMTARGVALLSSQRAHRGLTTGARLSVLRMTDRVVDGVVVNCEFLREHLIADEKVKSDKIHLCRNGIDLARFPYRDPPARTEVTFGCVCALRPEKNLPLLVEAFTRVAARMPEARLAIVGDGPERAKLAATDRVSLLPATREVAETLRSIDVFVLPSKTEAFSNALMEAMASGCAVIASRVGGNPELTGLDERGLLFPPDDAEGLAAAMLKLGRDVELRRSLARAARSFVESHLTIETSTRRMEAIYSEVLANRQSRSSRILARRS